jgi:PAS domain S-box-containing protein
VSESFDFEALIRGAGDAIVVAGPDGTILLWNRAAERIFGHTERERLVIRSIWLFQNVSRMRHWEGYRGVMQTGQTRYGADVLRVPALHKDGRSLSIAFSVALLYSPTQEVQAIAAIIRDETDRWEQERALRQRLAELEAKNRWSRNKSRIASDRNPPCQCIATLNFHNFKAVARLICGYFMKLEILPLSLSQKC